MIPCKDTPEQHVHQCKGHVWLCSYESVSNSDAARHKLGHDLGQPYCPTCQGFSKTSLDRHVKTQTHKTYVAFRGEPWKVVALIEAEKAKGKIQCA